MSVNLQFNVKPGDVFRYQATYTSSGTTTQRSEERVVGGDNGGVQIVDPGDPDSLVMVYDRRGYPLDVLQDGASLKAELPGEMFDISNRLIFPAGPVNPGDRWSADDGAVQVNFQLVSVGAQQGRPAAEIYATASGYSGPLKYWVELATGRLLRQEYQVGGTHTLIERV